MLDTNKDELTDLDEAFRTGRDVPEPWLAAMEGRASIDEAFTLAPPADSERETVRELFTPLSDAARSRIVDAALEKLRVAPAIEPVNGLRGEAKKDRRRWLWAAMPAVAAAALLLLVFRLPLDGIAETLPGEVKAFQSVRRDRDLASSGELRVPSDKHFHLECHAEDRDITVEAVKATRATAASVTEQSKRPGFSFVEDSLGPRGARLRVSVADLDLGLWEVTCGVADTASHNFAFLTPSARIVVER